MRRSAKKILLVQPRFSSSSFWNYKTTCEAAGARYSAAPLGLITVAALLPQSWSIRLVDRNCEELLESDIEWADLVFTGGMLPQQLDLKKVIALAHAHGKRVAVGGPDATFSPDIYTDADYLVLGEAEESIGQLLKALEDGVERGRFKAEGFPDVRKSPIPRFDLLKLENYLMVGVQLTRGCPFTCEFCNVVELNGHTPRMKGTEQMLAELDALLATGYRGSVDFVDDNLIGNRRDIKPFLAALARWNEERNHPFEYSSEASLNLASDPELLSLMKAANFYAVFIGIETPDPKTLEHTRKKQNIGRDIATSVFKIYEAGIFVNAGFIVGLDGEQGPVSDAMVDCIEDGAIPVCMVGLLFALPGTALAKRLHTEGRLLLDDPSVVDSDADQCTSGLNFVTRRPRLEILQDYRSVYQRIYSPKAYFGRVRRMARALDMSQHRLRQPLRNLVRDARSFGRIAYRMSAAGEEVRREFWAAVADTLLHNPTAIKNTVSMAALYLHIGPFSKMLDTLIQRRMKSEAEAEAPGTKPGRAASLS